MERDKRCSLLHRIGAQFNLALQRADYLSQVEAQTAKLTETAEREKASKELLQQQVIQLLQAVGPALQGDVTVRAQVTEIQGWVRRKCLQQHTAKPAKDCLASAGRSR